MEWGTIRPCISYHSRLISVRIFKSSPFSFWLTNRADKFLMCSFLWRSNFRHSIWLSLINLLELWNSPEKGLWPAALEDSRTIIFLYSFISQYATQKRGGNRFKVDATSFSQRTRHGIKARETVKTKARICSQSTVQRKMISWPRPGWHRQE